MRSKKAVEFRVLVLAIIAVVALFAAIVIFSSLQSGTGGRVTATIGGVNYQTPNIYEALMGIGVSLGACAPITEGMVDLYVGENDVCWSPPAPRYTFEASPTFLCPAASSVQKIVIDADITKDVTISFKDATAGATGDISPQIKGATTQNNIERTITNGPRVFYVDVTASKEVLFKDNKVVVKKITCSEPRTVDLEPLIDFNKLFLDSQIDESVTVGFGYRNSGNPASSCNGAEILVSVRELITNEVMEIWDFDFEDAACGSEGIVFRKVFTPPAIGIYVFDMNIIGVPDEENTDNNGLQGQGPVVSYQSKQTIYAYSGASFSVAKDLNEYISQDYWTAFSSNTCYHPAMDRDVQYVIVGDSATVNLGAGATDKVYLWTGGGTRNDFSVLPWPSPDASDSEYYISGANAYYLKKKSDTMSDTICAWFKDSNINNNNGQREISIYSLDALPNYACKTRDRQDSNDQIQLAFGENTLCWAPASANNKLPNYKSETSAKYKCPGGTNVKAVFFDDVLASGDEFHIKAPNGIPYASRSNTNGKRYDAADISAINPPIDTVYFELETASNSRNIKANQIYVKAITCRV